MNNLPDQFDAKGKLVNLEHQYFDEYFGLVAYLVKINKKYFGKDKEMATTVMTKST